MTDPNVQKVLRLLVDALVVLAPSGSVLSGVQAARKMIDEADALLAAEKPAAPATPALPWVVREREGDRRHVAAFAWSDHAESFIDCRGWRDGHEVAPAAPAIVPPAVCAALSLPDDATAEEACRAIARLRPPAIVPVKFGAAGALDGDGWIAEFFALESPRRVCVTLDLRPGEDAGERVARMLAAVGRGP